MIQKLSAAGHTTTAGPSPVGSRALQWGAMALGCTLACGALAQDYPSRNVTMVYPYGAGGGGDVAVRVMAVEIGNLLKQTFVIENRPGAGGLLGYQALK